MKTSTTIWLLAAVLGVAGLIWFVNRFEATRLARAVPRGGMVLPGVRAEEINCLLIENGDLHLDCVKKEDKWFVTRPLTARADPARIENILSLIESVRARETISAEQRARRDLTLEDYGLAQPRARFVLIDGRRRRELMVGRDSPLGDLVYVKLDTSDLIIATSTNLLAAIPPSVEFMRDRTVLHGEAARTTRLELQRPGLGFVQMVRQADRWLIQQPIQAYADPAKVGELLDTLYGLKVERFVWDRMGDLPEVEPKAGSEARAGGVNPDEATARITVWVGDDQVGRELLLGKATPEDPGLIYARPRSIDSTYLVRKRVLEVFSVSINELRERKIFPLTPGGVRYVRLERGSQAVTMESGADGAWRVKEPVQWKADNLVVNELVRCLAGLQIAEFADGSQTNLAALGLEPPSCIVQLAERPPEPASPPPPGGDAVTGADAAKEPNRPRALRLRVGTCPPGSRRVHVRFEDEPIRFGDGASVYVVPVEALQMMGGDLANPLAYRDRTMLAVIPENVSRITLIRRGVQQVVERDKLADWVDAGARDKRARKAVVDDVLFFASNLRAFKVESHNPKDLVPYGLDRPNAVLTLGLTGVEGIQKSILMGTGAGADGIYAMIQGQDVVFVMENGIAERLVRDLVEESTSEGSARRAPR